MSSRARPRGNHNGDTDEERRLWKEIKDRSLRADEMIIRSNAIGNEILDVETQQAVLIDQGKLSDMTMNEKLESLYRENLKLCEEIQAILNGEGDTNLLDSITILAGLREASMVAQDSAPLANVPRVGGKRDRPKKGTSKVSSVPPVDDTMDELSAAPSPRVSGARGKEKPSRAGSISQTRETSVKLEDGESVTSSIDTIPASGKFDAGRASRIAFKIGDAVLYKHRDRNAEGEGILCRVTAVIGEGKQRRYEIQDAEDAEDPAPGGKAPPSTASFRASITSLMQIPNSNDKLSELPKGRQVLALYPDTTTFYRGEVAAPWKAKDGSEKVQVKFEGEMDENVESQPVERRLVLLDK